MSRENRELSLFAVVALVIGLMFVVINNSLTKAPTDLEYYQTYFPTATRFEAVSITSSVLTDKVAIYNGDTLIGYFYSGEETSSSIPSHPGVPSVLRLHVFISADFEIVDIHVDLSEHTPSFVDGYLKPDLLRLAGAALASYDTVDLVGGASAYSYPVAIDILNAIQDDLIPVTTDYIGMIFPTYDATKLAIDNTFTGTALITLSDTITKVQVVNRQIVKDSSDTLLGYLYTLYGENEVGAEEYYHAANITILVGVSADDITILGVTVPEDTYHQTVSYFTNVTTYVEQFASTTLQTVNTMPDAIAGSTQSPNLIHALLVKLAEVLA